MRYLHQCMNGSIFTIHIHINGVNRVNALPTCIERNAACFKRRIAKHFCNFFGRLFQKLCNFLRGIKRAIFFARRKFLSARRVQRPARKLIVFGKAVGALEGIGFAADGKGVAVGITLAFSWIILFNSIVIVCRKFFEVGVVGLLRACLRTIRILYGRYFVNSKVYGRFFASVAKTQVAILFPLCTIKFIYIGIVVAIIANCVGRPHVNIFQPRKFFRDPFFKFLVIIIG